MKRTVALLAVVAVVSGGASGRTYMGYPVTDMPFKLAGGQIVNLPVTDDGPLPAENYLVKIEVAGFSLMPADSAATSTLTWTFAFKSKRGMKLEAVTVEQVYPDTVGVELVKDTTPSMTDRTWHGDAEPLPMTAGSTQWLFESGRSTFVFKITIKAKGFDPVVLYQPSWFGEESKRTFRKILKATAR
jgi:hypothetical protein